MKLCVLHISDLHRDPANPIRNDVLLDSLENDSRHYTAEEETRAKSPDLIIVSGDIIHGVNPNAADAEKELRDQYDQALDFLNRLADRFVSGDKQRVAIVPGNHDVSAPHFMRSLRRIDIAPDRKKELVAQLVTPGSLLRWSWNDLELSEIADPEMYARRLAAFAEFYAQFYGGMRTYDLDASKQFDLFDYPEFELTIAAFSSCCDNDLYNRQGSIHPGCLADASYRLRHPLFRGRLRVAVWHHNAEGPPMQSDYMDPDLVQNLIDRGFSLGFHGHQHRPQHIDARFRYGVDRKITVISAGTLCGGASYRYGRSYNVVEIDTNARTGRLHVREMQNEDLARPIWGRRSLSLNPSGYYDFGFDAPPEPPAASYPVTAALIEAQHLFDKQEYKKAADILLTRPAADDELARRLLLDCLSRLKDDTALIANFDPPVSETEAIYVMDALWAEGQRDRVHELLNSPLIANSTDPGRDA